MTARIPVFAPFDPLNGPTMSLGMLTAASRHAEDGRLTEDYQIHRTQPWPEVIAALGSHDGPAVVLCSNYVWNLDVHLDGALAAVDANPATVFVHGGPSTPTYDDEVDAFLRDHPTTVDVLVHGEGELALVDLLTAMAPLLAEGLGVDTLDPPPGTTVRTTTGHRRGPDRPRNDDLDALPSPFLEGEFDHLEPEDWRGLIYLEATRGCPYGCTFCDWGSSTRSRVRKFSLERIEDEMRWCAKKGFGFIAFADANFGMVQRDVEIIERLRDVHDEYGLPTRVLIAPAKNTTRHLRRILDVLTDAGINYQCQLGVQTTDGTTLSNLDRRNIPVRHFVQLAGELRRRSHLLECDLLVGLPGQTVDSFRTDLQFMIDHEINHKTWPTLVLLNAPINDPAYRARFAIETDDQQRVVSTSTFSRSDYDRMLRLLRVEIVTNRLGLVRLLLRFLQWDHGIRAIDTIDRLTDLSVHPSDEYPLLSTLLAHYVSHPVPPVGWTAFYDEVGRWVRTELGVPPSTTLDEVLTIERFLRPRPGRRFPETIELEHDVVTYVRSALRRLYADGTPTGPDRPLHEHPPGTLTVVADPLELCRSGPYVPRAASWTDAEVTAVTQYPHELLHDLTATYDSSALSGISDVDQRQRTERYLADIAGTIVADAMRHHPELFAADEVAEPSPDDRSVIVHLGRR